LWPEPRQGRGQALVDARKFAAYTLGYRAFPPAINRSAAFPGADSTKKGESYEKTSRYRLSVPCSSAESCPPNRVPRNSAISATRLPERKTRTPSGPECAADLSNVDKDKIARIEQMPDVQDAIQQEWDQLRKSDMQLAYGVNLTENLGHVSGRHPATAFDRQRLYVNPVVQSYVNHVGQRLVPKNSGNVYTFRVLYDPIPKALTLSTGTIYISTGLLSMLDTESELSYVLAHEIAHIELRQAYLRIRDKHIELELAKEKAEKEKIDHRRGLHGDGRRVGRRVHPAAPGVHCSAAAPDWPREWKWATTSFIRSLSP
jgi:hypothetical protein